MQFSNFEPAVRHSIIAISSLYEKLYASPRAANQGYDLKFAIKHYNAAIQKLTSTNNEPVILLVCVLFVCIEFLQGNKENAFAHSQHGIRLLRRVESDIPWIKEYLSPIFRRLGVVPFFFGKTVESLPNIAGTEFFIPASLYSLSAAQYHLDGLMSQTIQLVRLGDSYRYGIHQNQAVLAEILEMQNKILQSLELWRSGIAKLQHRRSLSEERDITYCNLLMRHDVCLIWTRMALAVDEVPYDNYIDTFRSLIRQAALLGPNLGREGANCGFSFEMGLLPLMYFVVMKCRDLPIRLEALAIMRQYGATREVLWDIDTMFLVARRFVEIEHEVALDELGHLLASPNVELHPAEENRIREFSSIPTINVQVGSHGQNIYGIVVNFWMRSIDGSIWPREEFLAIPRPMAT
jgi:hypothetical protein